ETGPLHANEFTMLEWYRAGAPYEKIMEDCAALARLAAQGAGAKVFRWKDRICDPFIEPAKTTADNAFRYFANLDLLATLHPDGSGDRDALARAVNDSPHFQRRVWPVQADAGDTWSDIYSKVLASDVEPELVGPYLTFVYEYPAPEAALARRCAHDPRVAE